MFKHACLPSLSVSVPSWLAGYSAKALGKASKNVLSNSDSEETRKKVTTYWHVHEEILFSVVVGVLASFTVKWQVIEVL